MQHDEFPGVGRSILRIQWNRSFPLSRLAMPVSLERNAHWSFSVFLTLSFFFSLSLSLFLEPPKTVRSGSHANHVNMLIIFIMISITALAHLR